MTRDGSHLGQCRSHTDMSGRGFVGVGFCRIVAVPRYPMTGRSRDASGYRSRMLIQTLAGWSILIIYGKLIIEGIEVESSALIRHAGRSPPEVGRKFGRVTIIWPAGSRNGKASWLCECVAVIVIGAAGKRSSTSSEVPTFAQANP